MPTRQQPTIPADPREWRPQSIHRGQSRPPLRQWFASWRSAGLKGLVLKSANGRYIPGGETSDWATVERMPRA